VAIHALQSLLLWGVASAGLACLLFAHGIAAWPRAARGRRIGAAIVVALVAANMAYVGLREQSKMNAPGYLQEWPTSGGPR
jgi:hypothetical protein